MLYLVSQRRTLHSLEAGLAAHLFTFAYRPSLRSLADHRHRVEPLLPANLRGKPRGDDRRVLSGIVHARRCGGRWADCADVYGPKRMLYNRFVRWSERASGKASSARWRMQERCG